VIRTPIGRLRVIGWIEGVSFLLLLGVAMPLKYLAGMPEYVRVVGMAHGILWMAYVASVWDVRLAHRWPLGRCAVAVLASILPFGPFVLDRSLKEEQASPATA
jgi:integral membrane protein